MSLTALIFMLVTEAAITFLTVMFFVKVLRAKPRMEPDSYLDNDELPDSDRTSRFEKEQ